MYLLDTNHCSHFINNHPSVIDAFQARANSVIGVSVITYGELFFMTEKSERKAENLKIVQEFLASVDLYLIDEETWLTDKTQEAKRWDLTVNSRSSCFWSCLPEANAG